MMNPSAKAWLCLGTLMLFGPACAEEPVGCKDVSGLFYAEYSFIQGNVSPNIPGGCALGPYVLPVEGGGSGVRITTRRLPDKHLEADVVIKGCSVGLKVKVTTPDGVPMAQIEGDVDVVGPNNLNGTVQGWLFDASGQNTRCGGWFDARLMRMSETVRTESNFVPTAGAGGTTMQNPQQRQTTMTNPAPAPVPTPTPMP